MRIINKDTFDVLTDPIFTDIKLLRLDQIYLYQLGKFMYLYRSGSLPEYFHNYFPITNEVHVAIAPGVLNHIISRCVEQIVDSFP